jgi:hypothetical protein
MRIAKLNTKVLGREVDADEVEIAGTASLGRSYLNLSDIYVEQAYRLIIVNRASPSR